MRGLLLIAAISAFSLVGGGCDSEGRDVARIRVFHASPDAPNIDVEIDSQAGYTDVGYGESTPYQTVDAGSRRFIVRSSNTGVVLVDETRSFRDERLFTYVVFDFTDTLGTLLVEDKDKLDDLDSAEIKVVNVSPSGGSLDVYITPPEADIETSSPLLFDLEFTDVSEYIKVPFGPNRIRVTPSNSKTVIGDSGTVNLSLGQILTVMVIDAPGGGEPLSLVILADRGKLN
jgi:hypothetical protein